MANKSFNTGINVKIYYVTFMKGIHDLAGMFGNVWRKEHAVTRGKIVTKAKGPF